MGEDAPNSVGFEVAAPGSVTVKRSCGRSGERGVLALCGDVGPNTLEGMFEKEPAPTGSLPQGLYLALQGHEKGRVRFL